MHSIASLNFLESSASPVLGVSPAYLRAEVFAQIPRDQLVAVTARVGELARPADDRGYNEGGLGRYSQARRFMPAFLRTMQFQGTPAGRSVLDALRFLRELDVEKTPRKRRAPLRVVSTPWRRFVLGANHYVDRRNARAANHRRASTHP